MFHAIKRAVCGPQKFFGRVAVFRIRGDTGAHGERGFFRFRSEALPNTGGDSGSDFLGGFRQNESEFIATVTRRRIDSTGMIAQDFAEPDERAAAH